MYLSIEVINTSIMFICINIYILYACISGPTYVSR